MPKARQAHGGSMATHHGSVGGGAPPPAGRWGSHEDDGLQSYQPDDGRPPVSGQSAAPASAASAGPSASVSGSRPAAARSVVDRAVPPPIDYRRTVWLSGPQQHRCQYCKVVGDTRVVRRRGDCLRLCPCAYLFFCLPCCCYECHDVYHLCSSCGKKVGKYSFMVPQEEDQFIYNKRQVTLDEYARNNPAV